MYCENSYFSKDFLLNDLLINITDKYKILLPFIKQNHIYYYEQEKDPNNHDKDLS